MRSVVLATCEGERFIDEQIDSICAQLGAGDEIIVCDDASADLTVAKIYARNDPRIKIVINEKRLGYVKNFEKAIEFAQGEFIFFSDQDDIWLPEKMEILEAALTTHACVASDAIVVNEDLQELHRSYFEFRKARSASLAGVLLRPRFIGATMACRRNYLSTLLPFPCDVPHDFWISLNAVWDQQMQVVLRPLILYRRHANTASISATTRRRSMVTILLERLRMIRRLLIFRIRYVVT